MSDAVLIALVAGPVTLLLTHYLGQRDRVLASEAVKAKDKEINELKRTIEARDATISRLRRRLIEAGYTP